MGEEFEVMLKQIAALKELFNLVLSVYAPVLWARISRILSFKLSFRCLSFPARGACTQILPFSTPFELSMFNGWGNSFSEFLLF